jgi:hypothetical protein
LKQLTRTILATRHSVDHNNARNRDVRPEINHEPWVEASAVAPKARAIEDAVGCDVWRRVGSAQVSYNGGDVVAEAVKRHDLVEVQNYIAHLLDENVPAIVVGRGADGASR